MTIRMQYSMEFKLDAICLVMKQGDSRSEAARSLDISTHMLGRWLKEYAAPEG